MKSEQWLKDREALRKIAREGKLESSAGTLVYSLISHIRSKLHMHCYGKYSAGWRRYSSSGVPKGRKVGALSREFHRAYGDYAKIYYYMIAIESLEDQAEWIHGYMEHVQVESEVRAIALRVLEGYPEVEENVCVPVVQQLVEQQV